MFIYVDSFGWFRIKRFFHVRDKTEDSSMREGPKESTSTLSLGPLGITVA